MSNDAYDLIARWAGPFTWYTSHPNDEQRFHEALDDIHAELDGHVDLDRLRAAIERHASDTLGTPQGTERARLIEQRVRDAGQYLEGLNRGRRM